LDVTVKNPLFWQKGNIIIIIIISSSSSSSICYIPVINIFLIRMSTSVTPKSSLDTKLGRLDWYGSLIRMVKSAINTTVKWLTWNLPYILCCNEHSEAPLLDHASPLPFLPKTLVWQLSMDGVEVTMVIKTWFIK
jgi:hypothetical protein